MTTETRTMVGKADMVAGCNDCSAGPWFAGNALGVAARHAQAHGHGHATYCNIARVVSFEPLTAAPRGPELPFDEAATA